MVLKRAALIVLALTLGACAKRVPPQRLPEPAALKAVLVLDPESRGVPEEAPAGLAERLAESLDSRNLKLERAELATLGGQTLSGERVRALMRAGGAPYLLVAETRAVFFSQLDGRYRWTVGVRLSATRASDGAAAVEEFNLPAVMQFDHQKGQAAVDAVADEIARRAALLFDALIASPVSPLALSEAKGRVEGPSRTGARPSSIYFVMVDRFFNGDRGNDVDVDLADPQAFHGGDLRGLTEKLDWLQSLGVDAVWLSPVFTMRHAKYGPHGAFHGYWVEDLESIEPSLGGEPALRALAAALHQRGMKLILDVVLNHAAPDGKLVKGKPEWFHGQGGIKDWNDEDQLTRFDVHGLPDLAQEKPEVYSYLLRGTLKWLQPGLADGLRLDAVKHMPAEFWRRFNAEVKAKAGPQVFLLGEQLEGDPSKLNAAWRGGAFDGVFDFPLAFALNDVFCKQAAPERLAAVLGNDRLYPDPSALVTLVDNHDLPRVMSACGGDERKVSDALTVLLTARGIPSLQQGTEVGLKGEKEPFNRGDMKFENGALKSRVQALLAARKGNAALREGAPSVLEAGGRFVALGRTAASQRAVIAVNGSSQERGFDLPGDGWVDAFDGTRVGAGQARVAPSQVKVWLAKGDFAKEARAAEAQWRTGARKRRVVFEVPSGSKVCGSGPELGQWQSAKGVTQAELPVGSVFEFKILRGGTEWEPGDNRVLFVADGDGPLAVK